MQSCAASNGAVGVVGFFLRIGLLACSILVEWLGRTDGAPCSLDSIGIIVMSQCHVFTIEESIRITPAHGTYATLVCHTRSVVQHILDYCTGCATSRPAALLRFVAVLICYLTKPVRYILFYRRLACDTVSAVLHPPEAETALAIMTSRTGKHGRRRPGSRPLV